MLQEILTYITVLLAFVYAAAGLVRAVCSSGKKRCTEGCCGCEAKTQLLKDIKKRTAGVSNSSLHANKTACRD